MTVCAVHVMITDIILVFTLSKLRNLMLCKNEEELKNVESAATAITGQGVVVFRDQFYSVKMNNTRADAVLMSDNTLKPNIASEIAAENGTEVAR